MHLAGDHQPAIRPLFLPAGHGGIAAQHPGQRRAGACQHRGLAQTLLPVDRARQPRTLLLHRFQLQRFIAAAAQHLFLPAGDDDGRNDHRAPDIQPPLVDGAAGNAARPQRHRNNRIFRFAVQLQHPAEGDLVLPAGRFAPGGNVQDIEGSQPLHLQPSGGNGVPHRDRGQRAFQDPADIGAVIRQQGIAFHGLLHRFLQYRLMAQDGLLAQFKLHFHSPLRSRAGRCRPIVSLAIYSPVVPFMTAKSPLHARRRAAGEILFSRCGKAGPRQNARACGRRKENVPRKVKGSPHLYAQNGGFLQRLR